MEFDDNNTGEEQEDAPVEIYSRRAIFWFFLLAGPMFGGVLLMLNLKAAGYKKAIYSILAFTVLFDIVINLLLINIVRIYQIDMQGYLAAILAGKTTSTAVNEKVFILSMLILAAKIAGALILTRYFSRKYFPDDDYYPKSIVSPLLFTIVVMLVLPYLGLGGIYVL